MRGKVERGVDYVQENALKGQCGDLAARADSARISHQQPAGHHHQRMEDARAQPRRGVGDGTLADYYSGLAKAHSGLHETANAVDAASAAVVAWGPGHTERGRALSTLKLVLSQADDMDSYATSLDKQKEQAPIVRKAIGQVYFDKGRYAQAIAHLRDESGRRLTKTIFVAES